MDTGSPWDDNPLLPEHVVPIHYDLTVFPRLKEGTFTGKVSIKININKDSDYLLLHQRKLDITSVVIKGENGTKQFTVDKAFSREKNEFWVIVPHETLPKGEYQVELEFSGSLLTNIVGFYRSSYNSTDGEVRYLATTKFEPTYARRAFPCFDEPSKKATFSIKVVVPMKDGYFALSNMDQTGEEKDTPEVGYSTAIFSPTPPMSTYLVCFIVCDFDVLEAGSTSNGKPVKLYARKGHISGTKYAGQLAVPVVDYFSKYFHMDYPLPKIDLIAVPDFVSGAMENWGLITFRETSLLAEADTTTIGLTSISGTVSHELAHMWFGDIVTMQWWDDLWLNEGFATFLATYAVQHLRPEMHAESYFVGGTMQRVLEDDAELSSHPIIQNVSHPDQITEMFDSISYSKGSSVLRMIDNFDKESFRTGVSNYLKKHKWGNARTTDLWEFLTKEYKSVKNLPHLLDTWTKQEGYPVVSVEVAGPTSITLKQTRFLAESTAKYNENSSPFGYKWDIPIKYLTSDEPDKPKSTIFWSDSNSITIEVPNNLKWFKLNAGQVGFYRVNYTLEQWMNFQNVLTEDPQNIPLPEDRSNLIDDAFNLASAGYIDYSIPLQLLSYLKSNKETHFLPWMVSSYHILRLRKVLYGTPIFPKFKEYVTKILEPVISDSIWEIQKNSSNSEKLMKSILANLAVRLEFPSAMKTVNELFSNWITGKSDIPSVDFKSTVYTYGMYGENLESNWNQMWNLYLQEQNPQKKIRLMEAIASVNDRELVKKLLQLAKNDTYIRSQDYFTVLFNIGVNPEGNGILWDFIQDEWEYLVNRFTLNDRVLGRVLPVVAKLFYTEKRLAEVQAFIAKYPEAGAGAAGRKRAIERIKRNIDWFITYLPKLEKWLSTV